MALGIGKAGRQARRKSRRDARLVSSSSGDKNSLSSGAFNQKIQDGLQDLIGGALGIRRSSIPDIQGDVIAAQEKERADRQYAGAEERATEAPGFNKVLEFPLNYFGQTALGTEVCQMGGGDTATIFPNSIHFKSLPRKNPHEVSNYQKGEGNWDTTKGKLRRARQQIKEADWLLAEKDTYDIFLHLPDKLRDDVKVEYSGVEGGAMAQFMARMFSFGADDDAVQKMQGKRNFDMDEIMSSFKGMMPGGDIVQKAAGYMTNPMMFQAMKNVNFRSYDYSFTLKPTSADESERIKEIVYAFKMSMLPGVTGENNGIWTLPNEWAINFQGPIAKYIDFPLTAVCQSAAVDYSQYLMAADSASRGRGAPSSITLTLNFIETMQLSRQRFHGEVSPFNPNRVSRAGEGTQLGANFYKDGDVRKGDELNPEYDGSKAADRERERGGTFYGDAGDTQTGSFGEVISGSWPV